LRGAEPPIWGQGEAQRAENGVGFLGRGEPDAYPPARGFGERCKLPRGVPAETEFGAF